MAEQDKYIDEQLENFGRRLKALRKEKGYTNYEQFAYKNEIGRAQYGRYEKGADLRLSTLLRVLRAMGVTPVEFFGEGFSFETECDEEK